MIYTIGAGCFGWSHQKGMDPETPVRFQKSKSRTLAEHAVLKSLNGRKHFGDY